MKTFGLSKNERIKHKKDFQKVYLSGQNLYSSSKKLKARYYIESSVNEFGIKAAFVVSKKAGNAVWRNRVKRILRATYRLNKLGLVELCNNKNKKLLIAFSPNNLNQKKNKTIKLDFIADDFADLLKQLKNKI